MPVTRSKRKPVAKRRPVGKKTARGRRARQSTDTSSHRSQWSAEFQGLPRSLLDPYYDVGRCPDYVSDGTSDPFFLNRRDQAELDQVNTAYPRPAQGRRWLPQIDPYYLNIEGRGGDEFENVLREIHRQIPGRAGSPEDVITHHRDFRAEVREQDPVRYERIRRPMHAMRRLDMRADDLGDAAYILTLAKRARARERAAFRKVRAVRAAHDAREADFRPGGPIASALATRWEREELDWHGPPTHRRRRDPQHTRATVQAERVARERAEEQRREAARRAVSESAVRAREEMERQNREVSVRRMREGNARLRAEREQRRRAERREQRRFERGAGERKRKRE